MTAPEVKVTQADLDAAADLIEQYWSGADDSMMRLAKDTRNGHRQGAFPRAFARHRATATAPLEARIALLEAGMGEVVGALKPFARIADMEEKAGAIDSVMVNVARCRDARTTLASLTAMLAEGGE